MRLADLPTPCLVLDRQKLMRNIRSMAGILGRHNVPLRPHMKTAKSIDIARLVLAGQPGGITVSTLAEAEYFASHGIVDILYAVGVTPGKLDLVAKLNANGAGITVITDDPLTADAIAVHPAEIKALIEIDCGEQRGGVLVAEDLISELADRLGANLVGVMTHAGHSYQGRSVAEIAQIAELERSHVVYAAQRLRAEGHAISIVSAGSSPTGRHAETMTGLTEFRAGVYMLGDLFQAEIETHARDSIALTVLTSVIGRPSGRLLVDAGALALSKDRGTESTPNDFGFGLVQDIRGEYALGDAIVRKAYQEHGVIELDTANAIETPVGTKLRILPNHACLTAAAHDRYYVIDGSDEVVAVWPRMNGW
ncbi:MAG: DSD1 family PLP-dependent enzyme [Acetobacteraceae bacterium]|nr:DSD1 family PLP-dependent enzyme [Acetobacteraceae bacterium]